MESSDKGKYIAVVVAIIGAIATVSVPIATHYFPTTKDKVDDPAKVATPQTAKAPTETPQIVEKSPSPKVEPVVPPPGEDGALNLQNVGAHIAVKDYGAAYRTAIYLVNAAPDNAQFHACLADLSISQGLMGKAADEFKRAADLGLTGMAVHEARVRDNIQVLNSGYLYVTGTEFDRESTSLWIDLKNLEIPGTIPFWEKLCSDAKKTMDYQNENYAPDRRMFAPYHANSVCTSNPEPGLQFRDCV